MPINYTNDESTVAVILYARFSQVSGPVDVQFVVDDPDRILIEHPQLSADNKIKINNFGDTIFFVKRGDNSLRSTVAVNGLNNADAVSILWTEPKQKIQPSLVYCEMYRLSTNPTPEPLQIKELSVCRPHTEEESNRRGINYSFRIRCTDQAGTTVGLSGQNDDSHWPAGCIVPANNQ